MNNLDDQENIKKLDTADVLGSIEQLGSQCRQAWEEINKLAFPDKYRRVEKIVFSGMGGSALGAYVVKSLFFDTLKIPFEIVNDYHLPAFTDEKTLVVLGTYSGTTEETLSCAYEAKEKGACLTAITTGGKLGEFLEANSFPAYIFSPRYNPSNQPRLGSGYSIFGLATMLKLLQIINFSDKEFDLIQKTLDQGNKLFGKDCLSQNNPAKLLAQKWENKIPIIVTAEFLTGVGRVIRNQIHETAKSFAACHDIPELNHHLMEGLSNPQTNKEQLKFLFLQSDFYSERIKKRFQITRKVIEQSHIEITPFFSKSESKLSQVFEAVQFGAYVNFYMAMIYGVDPSLIPWVDLFKKELKN